MAVALDRPAAEPREWEDFYHTGPDTLAGRYMRRFWHPVYIAADLQPGRAVPIRLLSEDFTLYRGQGGAPHVVAFRCAHRGTQLSTGWVEDDCIRCFYHGWKYDSSGQCVEQPAEDAAFAAKVKIRAYPTREYLGLIFAYLGEDNAPPFPRWASLEQEGVLSVNSYFRGSNVFNNLESNMDELHVAFVHRNSAFSTTGLNRDLPTVTGEETEYGIVKYGTRSDGVVRVSHFAWPNVLYIAGSPSPGNEGRWSEHVGWRVPVDDEGHRSFMVELVHATGEEAERLRQQNAERKARKADPNRRTAAEVAEAILRGELHVDDVADRPDIVNIQDYVAQAGQGRVIDRSLEHLGRSDVLVIQFRKIWERELRALAEGQPLKQWSIPENLAVTSGV